MRFTKMQGLGNDYLYVYGRAPENAGEISAKLSDRHFGAGSDGMIYIYPSEKADFSMRIFNADGSEAMMCGNGIRCVGKYLYDKGYTDRTSLRIETLSGTRTLSLCVSGGKVRQVTVDMGRAEVGEDLEVSACGRKYVCTPVSTGNPHAVIFTPDEDSRLAETAGPEIGSSPAFPGGANVEFVSIVSGSVLRMRVWERGSGVTMACGTGACASAAAAVSKGLVSAGVPVTVMLDGGRLSVAVEKDGTVRMTGPAETVYEGETDLC